MAEVNTSYQNAGVRGVPTLQVLDSFTDSNLTAGAEPAISQPVRVMLGDSLVLAQFTVVGLNAAGKLVRAVIDTVTPANNIAPIGVLMQAATSGAANATVYGEVSLTGCFNVGSNDAGADSPLVYDASFNTLAKKTTSAIVTGNPNLVFKSRLGATAV